MSKTVSNLSNIGRLMLLVGVLTLIPLAVILFYPDQSVYAYAFIEPGLFSIILGLLICYVARFRKVSSGFSWKKNMYESSLTVLFCWIWGMIIGAVPFVIAAKLTPLRALFESVSGWTTTGLSVMDVAHTAKIFLFHRSFMQYCGGFGFIMMMVMIVQGKQSMQLYNAEGHPDKLLPSLKKTARIVLSMYNVFLVLGVIAYKLVGMDIFDGINHTMTALSTGGFSTKLDSIGAFPGLGVKIVTLVLMLIGTINFGVMLLLVQGKVKKFFKVSEVKLMFALLIIFTPLVGLAISTKFGISFGTALAKASIDVGSAISTTGFASMSYANWPPVAVGILIILMIIGGGAGSTAGGIKISRIYIILRLGMQSIKRKIHPSHNVDVMYYYKSTGKTEIDKNVIDDSISYFILYIIFFIVGSLLITVFSNTTVTNAMFEFASSLSTVGLSIGITNPTTNSPTLIVEMIGMFFGRLEIFIVLVGMYSGFSIIRNVFSKIFRRM